ncbi:AAA family ATPase [Roseinatronobacter sp. HJB301]|uniref:AAA family ATPase n=2 Tax=Roseinatronobacter alkalisoli TaxID=3028235 RepID=A0ABT5T7K2_9RHOB|nr:AAA family ATPase [Roseinatronobacter sp. HJB301]
MCGSYAGRSCHSIIFKNFGNDEDGLMPINCASRHVIISGCSGGGKSTLLLELKRRGFETIEEPGRRIVSEELQGDGRALPWVNLEAFARKAIEMASRDRERVKGVERWAFFDRGLVDAAVALEHATGIAASKTLAEHDRFQKRVFLTPPWPEIYQTDPERRHDLDEGIDEYHRLCSTFEQLDYEIIVLPKVGVESRADFVLDRLN